MKRSFLFMMITMTFLYIIPGKAQDRPYVLNGKVNDVQGNPLAFAIVGIDSLQLTTTTDSSGKYQLIDVPAGAHLVTVFSPGFMRGEERIVAGEKSVIVLHFTLKEEAEVQELNEITIVGESEKEKLKNSAKAVDVIDTKEARLQSSDMGDLLAGTQGVSVRRSGGLGTSSRFSLNGLTDDQIRFFLDGIPLEFCGYTFGLSNVPVNLVDRIEIYKGVVPVLFGADALGGAVNIVSPKMPSGFSGSASYQTGSFGMNRSSLTIRYKSNRTGLFASGEGFYDYARNNYNVQVEVPDEKGKLSEVTVPRFHDRYRAAGASLTVGIKDRSWVEELSVKLFYTDFFKEIQHNNLMTGIPYGDVLAFRKSAGANLTFRKNIGKKIAIQLTSGYNYSEREFVDTSHCLYDWYGNCILVRNRPGEVDNQAGPSHQYTWNRSGYVRSQVSWSLSKHHSFRLAFSPTYTHRTGEEKQSSTYDPLAATGRLFNWVNGAEYQLDAFSNKLENIVFFKQYIQQLSTERPGVNGGVASVINTNNDYYGAGNALRYRLTEKISLKGSYEYATRLPRPDELFGDGQFILSSLDLEPERSHNANIELLWRNKSGTRSNWSVQTNVFLRKIDNLIILIPGTDRDNVYKNVFEATSTGMEVSTKWTSSKDRMSIALNSTYQEFYNSSREGFFERFYGDRIPNTPYFFANGSASYSFRNVLQKNTRLTFFWSMRYVHAFYRSWESAGIKAYKQVIPKQQIHTTGLTYKFPAGRFDGAITAEMQNMFNVRVYDFYGVQKPGRAFYLKLTIQY